MKKYSGYKDSGVEWIGEIPEHWTSVKLKHVTNQISDGTHFTPTYCDSGIPFLRVTDIHNESIDLDRVKFISYEEHTELIKRCEPEKGDLLLSKNGTIGLTKIVDWDWEFSIFVSLCLIKFKSTFSPELFSFLFQSDVVEQQISESSKKSTVTNLHLDKIRELKLLLPPLPEQQAIVTYLNEKTTLIDDLIKKKQEKIQLFKENRTALINQVVTKGLDPEVEMKDSGVEWIGEIPSSWKVKRLKYVGHVKYGLGQPPKLKDGGLPLIRATNVYRGIIDEKNMVFVDPEDIPYERDPVLRTNDIIVVRSGAYTADSAIIPEKFDGAITGYDMVLRCFKNYIPKFISYGLLSDYILKRQLLMQSLRAAQPHLNREELNETIVFCPPFDEQKNIVTYLDEQTQLIDQTIQQEEQKIELLKEYRQSLISEVVTGKICVLDN